MSGAARLAALELNDAGLGLAGPRALDGFEGGPGIALVEQAEILTGRAAEERARLAPRRVHSSYWAELALEPLAQPFPSALRTADLAFAQLEEIWARAKTRLGGEPPPEGVLLVAPGSFSLPQLGVALAVARRAGLPASGCVDAAVAAAAGVEQMPGSGRRVHLELERHRAVATELAFENAEVVRGRVVRDDRVGLAPLLDEWARAVARQFVRTTRFDPLHLAATEQELYQRLPGWLGRLAEEETIAVSIAAGGRVHEIELARPAIAAAASLAYERLGELVRSVAGSPPAALLLSHRVRSLPGLELPGAESAWLPRGAALAGALAHGDRIHRPDDEAVPLVVRLPRSG